MNSELKKIANLKFVNHEFEVFKKFMGLQNLPNFKLEYLTKKKDLTILAEHIYNFMHKTHMIKIDNNLPKLKKYAIPALYHEFVHLWDYAMLFPDNEHQDMLLNLYTEFHASQVEIMKSLEFSSYNEVKEIYTDSLVITVLGEEKLHKYLEDKLSGYKKDISKMDLYNPNLLRKSLQCVMYLAGYIKVCKIYCSDENYDNFLTGQFEKLLGTDIDQLIKLLFALDNINESTMMSIVQCQINIMKRFQKT